MTTPCWPDWLEDVWAKSPQENEQRGESLAAHTWGVLESLATAARLRPWLPSLVQMPGLWNLLFWSCWIHDAGKAASGFQAQLRGGDRWGHRHEVLSLLLVDWLAGAVTEDQQVWVAAAVASHHKDAEPLFLLYRDTARGEDDPLPELVAQISDADLLGLRRWMNECQASWAERLGFSSLGIACPDEDRTSNWIEETRATGHQRIRHWLRSYRRWLQKMDYANQQSLGIATLAVRGQLRWADHVASAHLKRKAAPVPHGVERLLSAWSMTQDALYAHQTQAMNASGNVILRAPTGSGKTEAALLWSSSIAEGVQPVPRLFYTLPFQASMNAMYLRLRKGSFPGLVGLEHSKSTLALYRMQMDERADSRWAERHARAARQLARLNCFPVSVLSPYQILKAPYRLKGYEGLFTEFFGAAFVFDEIHAYEADRLAMILATVHFLRENFESKFFVMSATLPSMVGVRLRTALGSYVEIKASRRLFADFRRHRLRLLEGDILSDIWLDRISRVAREGRSVLVCCNTVRRAQTSFEELEKRLRDSAEVVLLHGRFTILDRLKKEKLVREATGMRVSSPRPIVLVATQVVEVSLDIDLDEIYTDPAPLDALIQRFGRVNRSRTKGLAPVNVFTRPDDGQHVYDARIVKTTLAVLAANDGAPIDEEDIAGWLDEVYEGEIADVWNREYDSRYGEFSGSCLSGLRAFDSRDELTSEFYRAFDAIEVLPRELESVYTQLTEAGHPLEASQHLIPIRWRQLSRLLEARKAVYDKKNLTYLVDVDYDSRVGLHL